MCIGSLLFGTEGLVWYVTCFCNASPNHLNNYSIINLIETNYSLHCGTYGTYSNFHPENLVSMLVISCWLADANLFRLDYNIYS